MYRSISAVFFLVHSQPTDIIRVVFKIIGFPGAETRIAGFYVERYKLDASRLMSINVAAQTVVTLEVGQTNTIAPFTFTMTTGFTSKSAATRIYFRETIVMSCRPLSAAPVLLPFQLSPFPPPPRIPRMSLQLFLLSYHN